MAFVYLAADAAILEDRVQRLEPKAQRQATEDPFDLTNNEFKELHRLTPDLMFNLIDALEPRLQRRRITGLSAEKQDIFASNFSGTLNATSVEMPSKMQIHIRKKRVHSL